MSGKTQSTDDGTDGWNKVRNVKLGSDVSHVRAAEIARELNTTEIVRIESTETDGEFRITLSVDGGFCAFGDGTCSYAIKSVIGQGNPETVNLRIVRKRV